MTKTGWFFILPLLFLLATLITSIAHGYEWLQIRQYSFYVTMGSAALWLLLAIGWGWWQQKQNVQMANDSVCLVITPTATMAENPDPRLWHFLEGYLTRRWSWPAPHLCFEVLANGAGMVQFQMYLPASADQRGIVEQLMREYPGVEIKQLASSAYKTADDTPLPNPLKTLPAGTNLLWANLGLELNDSESFHDPYALAERHRPPTWRSSHFPAALLPGVVSAVPQGGLAGVQLLVRPASSIVKSRWERHARLLRWQIQNLKSNNANTTLSERLLYRIEARLEQPLQDVVLRVWAAYPDKRMAIAERKRLVQAIRSSLKGPRNRVIEKDNGETITPVDGRHFPLFGSMTLTSMELDRYFHIPGQEVHQHFPQLDTVPRPMPPHSELSKDALPDRLTHPGWREYGTYTDNFGRVMAVGHPMVETRKHTFVMGQTGSGKSVAAENAALQYIHNDASVMVVEPHADLTNSILAKIPRRRWGDVVVLDLMDDVLFRLSPFAGIGEATRDSNLRARIPVYVERIMSTIQASMGINWDSAPRMQEIIHHALTIVACALGEEGSMFAVARLMDDTSWRMSLVEKAYENPVTKAIAAEAYTFWSNAFPFWTAQQRSEGMAAARRRIKPFIDRPQMQFTLGLPGQTIDLATALNEGKIILVPMHDDIGLESKRLLGAYIIREVLAAVKSRAHDRTTNRQLTAVIIDEFPDFVGSMAEAVKDFLAQTRKYGVAITLLAQSIYQLPRDVQTEIHTNCGSLAFFRCTPEDAEIAARMLGHGVQPEDFWQLRPYHAYLKLMTAGGNLPPCSVKAYPPPPRPQFQGTTGKLPAHISARDWLVAVLNETNRPEMARLLAEDGQAETQAQQELLETLRERLHNLNHVLQLTFVERVPEAAVDFLKELTPNAFTNLQADWREFLGWRRGRLLAAPRPHEYGTVTWLKHLSSLAVGYHWAICEAEYLRNYTQAKKRKPAAKARETVQE